MPFLALFLPAIRAALGLVVSAVRTPIGAAVVAAAIAWLVAGHRERAVCSARAEALRLELQRAAESEHIRRESAIGAADAAGRAASEALARQNLDLTIRLKEIEDASHAADHMPCLARDSVMRLDRLAR